MIGSYSCTGPDGVLVRVGARPSYRCQRAAARFFARANGMMLGSTIGTTGGRRHGWWWRLAERGQAASNGLHHRTERSVSTDMYPAVTSPRGRAWLVSSFNAYGDTSQLSASDVTWGSFAVSANSNPRRVSVPNAVDFNSILVTCPTLSVGHKPEGLSLH